MCIHSWLKRSPERRTAILACELAKYSADIGILSEFAGESSLEVGAGYTCYWTGKIPEERWKSNVGFAIRTSLTWQRASARGINDRIMVLRIPVSASQLVPLWACMACPPPHHDQLWQHERPVFQRTQLRRHCYAPAWQTVHHEQFESTC